MNALFLTILEMSIAGSVVIGVILLVRVCLKFAPKVFSYGLWAVALFRLLCPVTVVSPLAIIPAVPEIQASQVDSLFPALTSPLPNPDTPSADPGIPSADMGIPSADPGTPSANMGIPSPNPGIPSANMATSNPDTGTPNLTPNISGQSGNPGTLGSLSATTGLSLLWGIGVFAMGLRGAVSWLKLRRRLVGAVAHAKGVWVADYLPSPFVLGLVRPRIYLPSTLGDHERHYILLHEKHHIRRGDHVVKLLAYLALCLHWFNPLVYLAFSLAGKDMEMSCDEAVIRRLGPDVRGDYAASLLALSTGRRHISLTPLAFGEGDPKGRIMNLSKWKRPAKWVSLVLGLSLCILAIALITTGRARPVCIQVGGTDYYRSGEPVTQLPEGSVPLGDLISITMRTTQPPEEDFSATNLDEKYAGCPIYSGTDRNTIYLMDYSGVYLPFVTPVVQEAENADPDSDFAGLSAGELVLVSERCVYMSPLSSFSAMGGDSGMRYILTKDSFIQERRDNESVLLSDAGQTTPKGYPVLSWQAQAFPWSDEEWAEICKNSLMFADPFGGRLADSTMVQVGRSEYLLNLDQDLYLMELSSDPNGNPYIWSIFSLIPEEAKGSAQWQFSPASSAGKPAFCFRLDMDYTEVSAVCIESPLMDFDAPTLTGYPTDHHLVIPAGRNLYWSGADENGQPVMWANISFTIHNSDNTIAAGTIYLSGEETTDAYGLPLYRYTATVVGTGLTIAQEENGAVLTLGQ